MVIFVFRSLVESQHVGLHDLMMDNIADDLEWPSKIISGATSDFVEVF